MISSIELQIISRILTSQDEAEIDTLCGFDESYYNIFKKEIGFILSHRAKYGDVPDSFTFQAEFPEFEIVAVSEPLEFLVSEIKKNKQHIILIETFNKIKDLGSGDVSEAWQYLSNQCGRANNLNDSRPMDIIKDAKLRADQIIAFNKAQRIPTGFDEIDKLMYGGLSTVEELLLIVARTNTGKAQPLWSKVLTPTGWKTMGDIKVGDIVVGKNNDNGKVVKLFPQGVKDYYKITFDDGTFTYCCEDHLWEVRSSRTYFQSYEVVKLADILHSTYSFRVDISYPLIFSNSDVSDRMHKLNKLADDFGQPMNSSGMWRVPFKDDEFCSCFSDLCRSLGVKVKKLDGYIECESLFNPFIDPVKHDKFQDSIKWILSKKITCIELAGQTECQCILLDNKSHTYITDDYIVTHNTWVTTKMMESAQSHGFPVLYYSPEMQSSFMGTRFDTWRRNFINSDLHRGRYSEEYLKYIDELSHEGTSAYILEDKDTPEGAVTVSVLQQLVKQLHIKLLIIDGLSYMKDEMNAPRDDIKYKNLCTGLFRLSKQFGCAVVVTMQANRETKEEKDDKGVARPTLYNVEGSDHPARICTQAFCLRQIFDRHILEIGLEKSRTAANTKPVFTYSWDPGSGQMSLAPNDDSSTPAATPPVHMPSISGFGSDASTSSTNDAPFATEDDDDVEF